MDSVDCKKKNIRVVFLILYDIIAVLVAQYCALLARFDLRPYKIEPKFLETAKIYAPINIVCTLIIFVLLHLYSSLWEYASVQEMINLVLACGLSTAAQIVGQHFLSGEIKNIEFYTPKACFIFYFFLLTMLIGISRFAYRSLRTLRNTVVPLPKAQRISTMILGAGDTAVGLIKEMQEGKHVRNYPVCVIDADYSKIGKKLLGVPIVGNDSKIPFAVERYKVQEIFIAIPKLSAQRKREILEICQKTGCRLRILPSMNQIVNDEVSLANLREVEIEDLLGRDAVKTDLDSVMGYISGEVVLVTGAGGSIGSELCRQIASHNPKQLILFDIYENTTYDIQLELKKKYPKLPMEVLIGSVRNSHRIDTIFEQYKPGLVFHAAAHKHVPLMEDSPNEAIKNNVFGTLNVARAAGKNGAKRMVLISTDKAVNPTNIMGASKRLCEMVIQSVQEEYPQTGYVAVRFGNVLGSNGSVIPLFKKQIAAGGPVTVTSPDIIRYFMTIPEAVSLVLQTGAYAVGGEIYVLDMGEPVKIDDMARNLIRLSGFEPDKDIPIVYTGLRPGEKMYEECLAKEEGLEKTANNLIFVGKPRAFDRTEFLRNLEELKKLAYEDGDNIKELVAKLVPEYKIDKSNV